MVKEKERNLGTMVLCSRCGFRAWCTTDGVGQQTGGCYVNWLRAAATWGSAKGRREADSVELVPDDKEKGRGSGLRCHGGPARRRELSCYRGD